MQSSRVFHTIPIVSSRSHTSTQQLVAMRRSRSRRAQRHTSTITLCSSAQKVYTPTHSSMRSAVTARCAVGSLLRSLFRRVGRWSASSRCWLKNKTCTCELGVCCPYLMSLQPDQETFAVDPNEAHLFPGPAAARGGDTPESGEEGIGACSRWRGCDRHCFDPPLQPLPTYHIYLT